MSKNVEVLNTFENSYFFVNLPLSEPSKIEFEMISLEYAAHSIAYREVRRPNNTTSEKKIE